MTLEARLHNTYNEAAGFLDHWQTYKFKVIQGPTLSFSCYEAAADTVSTRRPRVFMDYYQAKYLMTGSLLLRLREYTKTSDPLAQVAGTIGIVIAGNQPFYPLYLHAIAGSAAWPSWLTLFSTPFFVAVPALARRNLVAGRAMLLLAGVANTVLCVKMIGSASGVELFLFPCALLATILFRSHERVFMVPLLLLTFLLFVD